MYVSHFRLFQHLFISHPVYYSSPPILHSIWLAFSRPFQCCKNCKFPISHSPTIFIFLPFISLFCEFYHFLDSMFLPYNIQWPGHNLKVSAPCYPQQDPLRVLLTGGDGHLGQGGCGHAVCAWLPSIPLISILQWISL